MAGIRFTKKEDPAAVAGAFNGLSIDPSSFAVLGQDVGDPAAPAVLTTDREIPVNPFAVIFQDRNFPENRVRIGDEGFGTFQFQIFGDSANASLPVLILNDLDPLNLTQWRIYAQAGQLLIDENISAVNVLAMTSTYVRADVSLQAPAGIAFYQAVQSPAISIAIPSGIQFSGNVITNGGAAGAITITLPVPVLGATYKFMVAAAFNLTIQATAGSAIRNGALLKPAPGSLVNGALGSFITLVCYDGTNWVAESAVGAWI